MNQSIELRVDGMHCANCGLLIDETVEDIDGVTRCATRVRNGTTVVEFDAAKVDISAIVAAIAEAGYEAQPLSPGG